MAQSGDHLVVCTATCILKSLPNADCVATVTTSSLGSICQWPDAFGRRYLCAWSTEECCLLHRHQHQQQTPMQRRLVMSQVVITLRSFMACARFATGCSFFSCECRVSSERHTVRRQQVWS